MLTVDIKSAQQNNVTEENYFWTYCGLSKKISNRL